VSYHFGFLIESMVSVLLLMTILYCVRLSKQLRMLKADEQALRATISELVTATEVAERAIAGLKNTMREGDETLGTRLARGEQLSAEIGRQVTAGEQLMARLVRIVGATRADGEPEAETETAAPGAKAVAAAAQAFAERARARINGMAA